MIIPLRTDSRLRSIPYMNFALIAANVIVFFLTLANPSRSHDAYGLSSRQPQLLQFFTYQFLHDGWMHIIGNMLFLYIFGNNVNDRLGNVGYLALYLGGGIFAAIAYVLTSGSHGSSMVGASGSISAVTGAYLVLLPRSNITVLFFYVIVEVASLWFIAGFFVYDIYSNLRAEDNVAHMAHIGGTVFGFGVCMALLLLRLMPYDADSRNLLALIQHWNRRRQFRSLVAGGYNPFEHTQPGRAAYSGATAAPPPLPNPRTARVMEIRAAIAEALAGQDLSSAARLYIELKMLDPQQVLSKQAQLDVANYLGTQQHYAQAAEAYEAFLRQYGKSEQAAQVELMLGLIYARYLAQPDRAREYLTRAASKYHAGRELEMAQAELARLGAPPPFMPRG